MDKWWYSENGERIGPVTIEDLSELYEAGKITQHTMVWHEGMPEWQTLGDVEALSSLKTSIPPPLPPTPQADELNLPMAKKWPRFFARLFDLWWEVLVVAFGSGYVLGTYSAGFVEWINTSSSSQLFGLACLPFALLLDSITFKLFGNTPGKAMLGLRVTTLSGKKLSFAQYLGRNFSMWMSGFAFGLPLISLFTLANQASRVGKGKLASYDESAGFSVHAQPSGWIRVSIFSVAFISLFCLIAVLNTMDQVAQTEIVNNYSRTDYQWMNPVTQISTEIQSNWKSSTQQNDDQQEVYFFNEIADKVVVIFAQENAPGFTLHEYVDAFRRGTSSNMRFTDGGRFPKGTMIDTWIGTGSMNDDGANRLTVEIRRQGSSFWRVVTIQVAPYNYSDRLVKKLRDSLWSTVLMYPTTAS